MKVTDDQVRESCIAAGITRIPHHECGMCGVMVAYFVDGGILYFDPSCGCCYGNGPECRPWSSASDWINMQTKEEHRVRIASLFGLKLDR